MANIFITPLLYIYILRLTGFDGGYIHQGSWGRGQEESVDGTAVGQRLVKHEWGVLDAASAASFDYRYWLSQPPRFEARG